MLNIFQAGGPVMWPLLFCSILTLGVIIERGLFWWGLYRNRRTEAVAELARSAYRVAPQFLKDAKNDPVGKVLIAGLEGSPAQSAWRMQVAATRQISAATRYLVLLNTMVALAPLLGIFGTVLGIIQSFQLLGDATLSDPIAASRGLAQALITTAFGLAIAMPSLVAFKYFHAKVLGLQQTLEAHSTELEFSLGQEGNDVGGPIELDILELQQG